MKNFNRYCKIEIAYLFTVDAKNGKHKDNINIRTFQENKITFHIENTFLGDYGLANFNLYNLTAETKSFVQGGGRDILITCWAGYSEETAQKLFEGQVTNVLHLRQGLDIVTTIYARDGKLTATTLVNPNSYAKGLSRSSLLNLIRIGENGNMNLDFKGNARQNLDNDNYKFEAFASIGTYQEVLNRVLGNRFKVSFYRGTITIREVRQGDTLGELGGDRIEKTLSVNTGLLGFPTLSYYNVEFSHMLDPILQPGAVIGISPITFNLDFNSPHYEKQELFLETSGTFRVMAVIHDGDTRGEIWSSKVEAYGVGG